MNQMVGSSCTSLSSVVHRKIDIDTPHAFIMSFTDDDFFADSGFVETDVIACVAFRMEIGDLIDSEIMQIIPIEFARDMVSKVVTDLLGGEEPQEVQPAAPPVAPPVAPPPPPAPAAYAPPPPVAAPQEPVYAPPPQPVYAPPPQPVYAPPPQPVYAPPPMPVQPAEFQPLNMAELTQQKENIGIIMDVPLEVTVELGRATKKIREILEFVPGTIVNLDKIAGEPIDILVNGKLVASGEVVVTEENFAVRVIDIVSVDKRI
jgi:flagellar motor switch protein FliN/FliY